MQDIDALIVAIEAGDAVDHATLTTLTDEQRAAAIDALLVSSAGRRWLRADLHLTAALAGRLLAWEADFRQPRRDRTLANVVERARPDAIERHINAIAAGSAAAVLWRRLADEPKLRDATAIDLVSGSDHQAAAASLHLLVLDPLDPFGLGDEIRSTIAANALTSTSPEVRGLAAEFLAGHAPDVLALSFDRLIVDDSERVRGIVWAAGLRLNPNEAVERAMTLLGDETVPVPQRRSALNAVGTALPTPQIAELLAWFVVHPDHELASDAARLLYDYHRNPITAEAARESPHADVREIAERLLDPLRGSPAAGGSRPGDPTRSSADIYAGMIRQLEERTDDQTKRDERSS